MTPKTACFFVRGFFFGFEIFSFEVFCLEIVCALPNTFKFVFRSNAFLRSNMMNLACCCFHYVSALRYISASSLHITPRIMTGVFQQNVSAVHGNFLTFFLLVDNFQLMFRLLSPGFSAVRCMHSCVYGRSSNSSVFVLAVSTLSSRSDRRGKHSENNDVRCVAAQTN